MSDEQIEKTQKQVDRLIFTPARQQAVLMIDHAQRLTELHLQAGRAYSELLSQQMRAAMDIIDVASLRTYAEHQQQVAQDIGERVKDNTQKVVNLNQDLVGKSQRLVEESVASVSKPATEER